MHLQIGPTDNTHKGSFLEFLWKDTVNRTLIFSSIVIAVSMLCFFKHYYPYPAFINGDSYQYLISAFYNLNIDIYPIGYSKFLRLISVFSFDALFLVVLQYMLVQLSVLCLLFTVFYFYNVKRSIQFFLLLLLTVNPVILYMSNYVSSDSLFLFLGVCWFSSLIWILNRPSWRLILLHAILVLLAFMVRYNALYYPFVSVFAFVLGKTKIRMKVVGVGIVIIFIGIFVFSTSMKYKKLSGVFQFSPFSGWQMANNGIYAYRFVDSSDRVVLPPKFKVLDAEVRRYFDANKRSAIEYPEEMIDISAVYMWKPSSPLRKYMKDRFLNDSTSSDLKKWSKVAPLYGEYGSELIKTYPLTFARSFLWPNLVKYYAPPIEFLQTYGFNVDTLNPIANTWFRFKEKKLESRFRDTNVEALEFYPIICGMLNAVYIMMSISFFLLNGKREHNALCRLWLISFVFWICNLLFSVFASPVALRFQVFSIMLNAIFSFLILDFVLKKSDEIKKAKFDGSKLADI